MKAKVIKCESNPEYLGKIGRIYKTHSNYIYLKFTDSRDEMPTYFFKEELIFFN